mgnify:CR=1 FL=1
MSRQKTNGELAAFNMGYVNNKVTKSNSSAQAKYLVQSVYTPGEVYEGKPINGMFSYRFAKLDDIGMPMFYDKNGNVLGVSDDEIVNADLLITFQLLPDLVTYLRLNTEKEVE